MPRLPRPKEVLEKAKREAHQEMSKFVQSFDSNKKLAVDYLDSVCRTSPSKSVEIQVHLTFTNLHG